MQSYVKRTQSGGKGDRARPMDKTKYDENFDRIFPNAPKPKFDLSKKPVFKPGY